MLGDIHDCDVMLPRVAAQIERLRAEDVSTVLRGGGEESDLDPSLVREAPHRAAYRGLELLTVHLEARRALLYERFLELWRGHVDRGTWSALDRRGGG